MVALHQLTQAATAASEAISAMRLSMDALFEAMDAVVERMPTVGTTWTGSMSTAVTAAADEARQRWAAYSSQAADDAITAARRVEAGVRTWADGKAQEGVEQQEIEDEVVRQVVVYDEATEEWYNELVAKSGTYYGAYSEASVDFGDLAAQLVDQELQRTLEEDLEEELEQEEESEQEELEEEAPAHRKAPPTTSSADSGDDGPGWWAPHAVLGALVLIGILGFFGAFSSSLGPLLHKARGAQPSATPSGTAAPNAH